MRVLSAFAVVAAQVYAALFETSGVDTLTSDNWKELIEDDADNAWVVTFYADWCPYCKTFSDEYAAAVISPELEDKKVKFGALDVMANRDLTKKFGIKRSPTVKIFGKDREAPEDYTGQRKTEDLVSRIAEFCKKNDFVVAEEVLEATKKATEYQYNIDSVVKVISEAHTARVKVAKDELNVQIKDLEKKLSEKLEEVKKDYQTQLEDLAKERKEALKAAYDAQQEKITDAKSEHALSIANLDDEAITVIESVIAKQKEDVELSDYIDKLAKDWFTITWDHTNRRKKGEAAPATAPVLQKTAPTAAGYATGMDPYAATVAPAPVVPQVQGAYGAAPLVPGAGAVGYGAAGYGRGGYQQAGYQQTGYGAKGGYGGAARGYGGIQQQRGYGVVQQQQRGYGGVPQQRGYGGVQQRGYGGQYGGGYQQRGYQGGTQRGYY